MSDQEKLVLIVHAIDTEGPLYESPAASFERLEELFGITGLPKTPSTLEKLRNWEIDLGGNEGKVAESLNSHRTNFMADWGKLNAMLERCMSPGFRNAMPDSFGAGWVYNWHTLDFVGYDVNPRRRDMGHHNIFDHYQEILARDPDCADAVHFHFHPMSTYNEAHRCATSYLRTPYLWDILCRKVIERAWFPVAFRAGFQAERPDSHWFLEQFIPFDISNMATDDSTELDQMIDFRNGRSGDWRRAPADWSVYHPDHDDYQKPGQCRRVIGRALNVFSRVASIDQREMDKAFARADTGQVSVVGICSHDWRDLGPEVDYVRELTAVAQKKYPNVKFKYAEEVEAFRTALGYGEEANTEALDFTLELDRNPADDVPNLTVETKRGRVFGPQPFLAIETRGNRFIHDNFDFSQSGDRWHYAFHGDTLPLADVRRIGVGAADKYGNACVRVVEV
ncbi:MAG: hypothetical protein RH946_05455 [Rhodospirillales bacterium]